MSKSLQEALKAIRNNEIAIDLTNQNIGDEGCKILAEWLKVHNTNGHGFFQLKLAGNQIGDEGAKAIAEVLSVKGYITHILFSNNKIGDVGAKALSEAIMVHRKIVYIPLDHNKIGDVGAKAFAEAYKAHNGFGYLHLHNNQIGDEGAKALAAALKVTTCGSFGDLSYNQIGDEGAKALAKALKTNKITTYFQLAHNQIGDEGAKAIAKALKTNNTITNLYLNNNQIGDEGAQAFAETLRNKNPRSMRLNLSFNQIQNEAAQNIINVCPNGIQVWCDGQKNIDDTNRFYITAGDKHMASGRYQEGIEEYKKVLKWSKNNNLRSVCHYKTAICLRKMDRLDEALEQVNKALVIDNDSAEAKDEKFEILLKLAEDPELDNSQAVIYIEQALEIKPADAKAVSCKTKLLDERFEILLKLAEDPSLSNPQAIFYIERALGIKPDDVKAKLCMAKLLVVQQEYAKALDYCARGGVEYTECLKNLAEDLYVKGRYSEACDYYKMFAPQTFNTLLNASKCFAKVLCWKESLDYANKALGVQHADSGALVIKFQALVGLGKQQMDAGHHDQAITYLNQALQIKQDDQEVKNLLGEALITIGVYQQALECYPAGTEKYKFCLERLAEEEFRNPDYTKALKHYEDLLLRLPENQGLKNKIGSILQRLGKDEEALNYYVKDTTEYIAAARKVLQDLRLEGQNKLDQHKAYEAIKCYKEVLSKQPALLSADECRNNPIYLKLSECYRGTEKPEKSLFWVNKVLAENPDDRKAKVEKARSLESIGESLVGKSIYGDAIMHLKEALSISASLLSLADVKKIKIKLGKVYEKLGEIYGKVEDNNSALYLYRELYSVAPEDEQVKIRMGSILEKLGEFDEAAKYFEAGSEDWKRVNAKRFENILKEGDTLFENKNYNQAVGKYEEALKIKPNQASVLVKKAKCFNISKEYDKALNCVNEIDVSLSHEIGLVEEIKNIKLQALKSKGEYLKQIDQLEKAAECFAEVLELQPTEEHRVQLCLVYYDSKQYDIALNHLRGIRKEYLRTVEDSKVKLKFAWLFMKQEIYDEALNLFSQVNGSEKAEANVGCGIAYNRLGEQSYRQDNYNKAKRYFEDALKYDSDELYEINLGFTHMALKEYEKSLGCFGRVDQDERKLLGQEEALNRLIEKNKKSEDIGQIAKVLEYYDQLFEISQQHNHHQDRNLDYLCNKARFILDRTADYDNARRVAEKAKEIDPTYELAQQILDECDGLLGMGSFIPEVDF